MSETAGQRLASLQDKNWSAKRVRACAAALTNSEKSPIAPDWLMMSLVDHLPDNAIVVDEGLTTTYPLLDFLPFKHRYDYFGNYSGGIGWGIAAAVGVQLAQPESRVVAIIGDGSAMYSIQALWSAAKQKLPMIFVIANNGGYRVIKQRLKAFHGNDEFIGMDFQDPGISPAKLAEGFGMHAVVVETPAEFDKAMNEANASLAPVLIDVAVQSHV